jgi:hypothetical protein
MKRWYSLLLPVFFSASLLSGYAAPQDRQYVDYFLRLQAADLFRQKSFLLNWSCAYVNQNRLLGVDLCFSCYRSLSINQARKLLVGVAQEIVDKINNDPSIRERNLLPEPFTLNQLYLKIETDNVFSQQADMETVQTMCLDRGNITYYSYPASTLFYGRVTKSEETLEQAQMLLGEKVPFSGAAVLPKQEPPPIQEAAPTPPPVQEAAPIPERTFTRTIEPAEEAPMTPLNEVQRVMVSSENMLEGEVQAPPVKQEMLEESFLTEVFSDLCGNSTGQEKCFQCKMIAQTSFPEANTVYRPHHLSVENLCFVQETPKQHQSLSLDAAFPLAPNTLPVAARITDTDRPLAGAFSVPYTSIDVCSSLPPEAIDSNKSAQSALCWNEPLAVPKDGGENLVQDESAESFAVGSVAELDPANSCEEEEAPKEENPAAEAQSGDTQPLFADFSKWLHVPARKQVAETPQPVPESTPTGPARGVVPSPELIDETQGDAPLETSSIEPIYQKVMNWLRVSNESLASASSEGEAAEENANSPEESTPWYKSAMALFQGAPREEQEEAIAYLPPTEDMAVPDARTDIASRLDDVNRPDDVLEDLEEDMGDDDDDDDETAKPGVLTRAFSAIHSLWQSAIGEPSATDAQKNLEHSTASSATKNDVGDPHQPS